MYTYSCLCAPPTIWPVAMQVTLNCFTHTGLYHTTVHSILEAFELYPTVMHFSHLIYCPCPFHFFLNILKIFHILVHVILHTVNIRPITYLPAFQTSHKFKHLFAPCPLTPEPLFLMVLALSAYFDVFSSLSIKRPSSLGSLLYSCQI